MMAGSSWRWLGAAAVILHLANAQQLAASELTPLTIDRLLETPALTGTSPSSPQWSPDSSYLAFTWNNEGLPQRSLWVASQDGSDLRRLGSETTPSAAVEEFAWLPDSKTILSLRDGAVWETSAVNGHDTLITAVGSGSANLTVSPDARKAAYLRNGDLWLVDLRDRTTIQATDVGIASLSSLPIGRYSRPEREIGPGIWGGPTYAWSPDGKYIAVHFVDRRNVRKVPFPYYLDRETVPNEVRRAYPGDANELRSVGLLRVSDNHLQLLDLKNPTENQVVGFSWSPHNVLLIDQAADTNVDRWLYTVTPGNTKLKQIWHSHRPSRVYTTFASAWHPDGKQVIFLSDLGDRYGLYGLNPKNSKNKPRLLTDPLYDVLGPPTTVAADNSIFYPANESGPYERNILRIDADSGNPKRVADLEGDNTGFPSPDGRRLAVLHNDDITPTDLYIADTQNGDVKRITTSPATEFRERTWVRARYVTFPSKIDNYVLHARVLEPTPLDPGRKYPVVVGPQYSNTVRNRWAGLYSSIQQLMVQNGYIVVQVDIRGSTGYGRDFREEFLADFAGNDIEDLASAVEYLKTLPHVDPERFGIWGSSYGGTLTVFSLLKKPGLFRAGVAGAAAVDPHFFGPDDVAIVRRPDDEPEIFQRVAARLAANLEDHLLIIHGMEDQVVPFKTTVELAEALIRNGKDFDFAFAPAATHGWTREPQYARYLLGKLLTHFDRYLKPTDTSIENP